MVINFHSALFAAGALVALWVYQRLVCSLRTTAEASLDVLVVFFTGLLGARLAWAIWMGGQSTIGYLSFWDVGLISWGGILIGGVVALTRLRHNRHRERLLASLLISILIGWTIGRLGNFLQGDAYGLSSAGLPGWLYGRVPIQLYEAGLTVVLAWWLKSRLLRATLGRDIWWVAVWYGAGRILIDHWRDLPSVILGLNGSQLAALALTVCGIIGVCRNQTHTIILSRPSSPSRKQN